MHKIEQQHTGRKNTLYFGDFVWIKYTVTSEILLKELQVHNKIKIHVSFVNIVSGTLFFEKKPLKNPS